MACKSSWFEEESERIEYSLSKSVPLFDKWKWEIIDAADWVTDYARERGVNQLPDDLLKSLEIAGQYSSADPPAWQEVHDTRLKNDLNETYKLLGRKEIWYAARVEELELALCILRTWIMNHFDPGSSTKPLRLSYDREKRLHSAHRNHERKLKVSKLEKELHNSNYQMQKAVASEKATLTSKISEIESRLAFLKNIPEEVLLKNRELF